MSGRSGNYCLITLTDSLALAASGGKCTLKATQWILHNHVIDRARHPLPSLNSIIRTSLNSERLPSIILWATVLVLRMLVRESVDEPHRFNEAQQDSFLPVIEDASIVFVGATMRTHLFIGLPHCCLPNHSFHLITLNSLQPENIVTLLNRAAIDSEEKGVEEEVLEIISLNCDGDARVALNALEISATIAAGRVKGNEEKAHNETPVVVVVDGENVVGSDSKSDGAVVSVDDAKEALQCSDASAAIYWLDRMLQGGEEPLYIPRRLIWFACEYVGLADPTALNQSLASQCVAYLALAPESVAVYQAIGAAQKMVKESAGQNEGLMKEIGYGKGYIYPPNDPLSSSLQTYLPSSLQGYTFLNWPGPNPKSNR
ncbi:hypothetical protein MKW98_013317 [Papaver atlanticum]|uniref:MgsA AAA+ ATPase C-terminal domain-containing protein n=1 Tax=Papaver atlanticum TaxID=357466 RepID=A0AAD4SU87_9MAGN|nr:hypothetical protein MKW98_013317 [Papaver atlanticum]